MDRRIETPAVSACLLRCFNVRKKNERRLAAIPFDANRFHVRSSREHRLGNELREHLVFRCRFDRNAARPGLCRLKHKKRFQGLGLSGEKTCKDLGRFIVLRARIRFKALLIVARIVNPRRIDRHRDRKGIGHVPDELLGRKRETPGRHHGFGKAGDGFFFAKVSFKSADAKRIERLPQIPAAHIISVLIERLRKSRLGRSLRT